MRYLAAVAYAGRLYVEGIRDRGPWDADALIYWEKSQLDLILNPLIGDRKVTTSEELRETVTVSGLHHPAIKVWVREGLEEAVCELWEETGVRDRRPRRLAPS